MYRLAATTSAPVLRERHHPVDVGRLVRAVRHRDDDVGRGAGGDARLHRVEHAAAEVVPKQPDGRQLVLDGRHRGDGRVRVVVVDHQDLVGGVHRLLQAAEHGHDRRPFVVDRQDDRDRDGLAGPLVHGREPTYSVCPPRNRHASGNRRYARTRLARCGRRLFVVYGRNRTIRRSVRKPLDLGGLHQAPLGQGDLVVDEVPVRRPDQPDVGLQDDHAPALPQQRVGHLELADHRRGGRQVLQVVAHEDRGEVTGRHRARGGPGHRPARSGCPAEGAGRRRGCPWPTSRARRHGG